MLLLPIALQLSAEAKIQVFADKSEVKVNDRIAVIYHIDKNISEFYEPSFKPFIKLKGPEISNVSDGVTYKFILKAIQAGDFTIPPAYIVENGKREYSEKIKLSVIGGSMLEKQPQQDYSIESQADKIFNSYIFIRPIIAKPQYYLGEEITVSYYLYVHSSITLTEIIEQTAPSFNNAMAEEADIGKLFYEDERIGQVDYRRSLIRKYAVTPMLEGVFNVPLMSLKINAAIEYSDAFSHSGEYYKKTKIYTSASKNVDIIPLPPKPNDFSGAVGNFKIKLHSDKQTAKPNETVQIFLDVSGKGNFYAIDSPNLKLPNGMTLQGSPRIADSLSVQDGTSGIRQFAYSVEAKDVGNYSIAPISFTFFSPEQSGFITVKSNELSLGITNIDADESMTIDSVLAENAPAIEYFSYVAIGLIAVLLAIYFVKRRKADKSSQNADAANEIGGTSSLDEESALDALYFSLSQYLCDTFSVESKSISPEVISAKMQANKVPPEIISDTIQIMHRLRELRFSGRPHVFDIDLMRDRIRDVMAKISTIMSRKS